ncbi:hypothetical protein [Bacillus sp. SM2101]|uniref:hypothetical protein n=1 Tax=Bacillus sp. SM2101 TaxID=2805366 RepID=UPI001BDF5A88|nr:hypothetical protein [Bacillus sp. SM2101]
MIPYISAAPFKFSTLYDYLVDLTKNSSTQVDSLFNNIAEKDKEIAALREGSKELNNSMQTIEIAYKNQTKMINHVVKSLIRISSNQFNKDDLMLGIDYSLFELKEDKLILRASHGLTRTPDEIDLNKLKKREEDWAVIYAMKDDDEDFWEDESHGRKVFAKRFKMEDNTIYVYSFHFHENQTEYHDIIYSKDVLRVLYALVCQWHCRTSEFEKGERTHG